MSIIEKAVSFMVGIANDASHGYDQANRWGPDYDCSSLVITSWQTAGVPVRTKGATYTGNMYKVFLTLGFQDVTSSCNLATGSGMKRGDVLLNHANHTAMYIGNGQIVQASINEKGKVTGGRTGDQRQLDGQRGEINTRSYYNYPWDCVLRYTGDSSRSETNETETGGRVTVTANLPILKKGMTGSAVGVWQTILCLAGFDTKVDKSFGPDTEEKTESFERSKGITDDPNEVGPAAWKAGLEILEAENTF